MLVRVGSLGVCSHAKVRMPASVSPTRMISVIASTVTSVQIGGLRHAPPACLAEGCHV